MRAVIFSTLVLAAFAGQIALGPYEDIIVSWTVSGANATFTMTCKPQNVTKPPQISWCAFGVNTPGTGTGMAPANVFWLGIDNVTGAVHPVEDRIITVTAEPPCAATQLTSTTAASYTGGVLSATFTRPLVAPPALVAQGYVSFVNAPMAVVAAIGGGARSAGSCIKGTAEHYSSFHNIWLNFLGA